MPLPAISKANPSAASGPTPQPPVARRDPTPTTLHGVTLQDDYRWMRDKESAEVLAYLNAENAYTAAFMASTTELQAKLYAEMLSHIKETDESVPYRLGGWFYSTRTVEGSQYPINVRRAAANPDLNSPFDPAQPEQVILDVNRLAEGKPFMAIGGMSISPDGNLLAYSTDSTGFRQYTLHIRDLGAGTDLPDTAERVGSLAWAADSRTLFYSTEDETTKRHDHIFRHTVGAPASEDTVILHEEDERFNVGIGKTRDGLYLMIEAGSHTTNEYRFLLRERSDRQNSSILAPRVDDQEYYPDHRASPDAAPGQPGLFYIRTNYAGKNFRVVTAPVSRHPAARHWTELGRLRSRSSRSRTSTSSSPSPSTTRRKLGLPTLEVLRFRSATESGAPTTEPGAPFMAQSHRDMSGFAATEISAATFRPTRPHRPSPSLPTLPASHVNRIFTTRRLPLQLHSRWSLHASVYEYNVARTEQYPEIPIGESKLAQAAGSARRLRLRARYASERVWVAGTLGQELTAERKPRPRFPSPSSIVAIASSATRTNPLYIYGYGSYGYPLPVAFSPISPLAARPRRGDGIRPHPRRRRARR